jgi:hypothetical protein
MYQSPVAAVAELISNTWDADAENVEIHLPQGTGTADELIVQDDGIGMTFEECQERFLNVGWCRRGTNPIERTTEKHRPVIGRKGIGKFAGFGIARTIQVDTTSKITGEKTSFLMDIDSLRAGEYVQTAGGNIPVLEYQSADEARIPQHGTTVHLRDLKITRRLTTDQFIRSMARRFLLCQRADVFNIQVDGMSLPKDADLEGVEFSFPNDYKEGGKPSGLESDNTWGIEHLPNGHKIKWRVYFYKSPIEEEELRGLSVFSNGKLAQKPFFFNLTGGLGGQQGQEYMSGQVEADYIDGLDEDIIATERQRINWEHIEALPLQEWGQKRVKDLLRLWHDRRGEEREKKMEEKLTTFSSRFEKLTKPEQRTVKRALSNLAKIPTLSDDEFHSLGEAILTAWEMGRLKELIDNLANADEVTADKLLGILVEADVLVALNLAEAVGTKIEAIKSLDSLIEKGELENKIRDYIAERPYLLHPRWETFKKETSVRHIMDDAASRAGLTETESYGQGQRIDLALRSNEHLLVVEFMRPGKMADWDHISRCERYVLFIREKVQSETNLGIKHVTGLIVADRLDTDPSVRQKIIAMESEEIFAYSWKSLLNESTRTWREFFEILQLRAPSDQRLQSLLNR